MTEAIQKILIDNLKSLNEAKISLRYSYEKCLEIGIKDGYDQSELESFEALSSRFARVCDIVTQKVLKSIDAIELETPGTVRDLLNKSEKKSIIPSAIDLARLRYLRNDIVHEYLPEIVQEIFKKVIKETPTLLNILDSIQNYSKQKYGI